MAQQAAAHLHGQRQQQGQGQQFDAVQNVQQQHVVQPNIPQGVLKQGVVGKEQVMQADIQAQQLGVHIPLLNNNQAPQFGAQIPVKSNNQLPQADGQDHKVKNNQLLPFQNPVVNNPEQVFNLQNAADQAQQQLVQNPALNNQAQQLGAENPVVNNQAQPFKQNPAVNVQAQQRVQNPAMNDQAQQHVQNPAENNQQNLPVQDNQQQLAAGVEQGVAAVGAQGMAPVMVQRRAPVGAQGMDAVKPQGRQIFGQGVEAAGFQGAETGDNGKRLDAGQQSIKNLLRKKRETGPDPLDSRQADAVQAVLNYLKQKVEDQKATGHEAQPQLHNEQQRHADNDVHLEEDFVRNSVMRDTNIENKDEDVVPQAMDKVEVKVHNEVRIGDVHKEEMRKLKSVSGEQG